MNIDGVNAALGTRFDADEAAIIARMLRECGGSLTTASSTTPGSV